MTRRTSEESFWAMLKRGYRGVCHRVSPTILEPYLNEFARWHDMRDLDTVARLAMAGRGHEGSRLQYRRRAP